MLANNKLVKLYLYWNVSVGLYAFCIVEFGRLSVDWLHGMSSPASRSWEYG